MRHWLLLGLMSFGAVLQAAKPGAAMSSWETFKKNHLAVQKTVPGWCSTDKATRMMDLIHTFKPEVCVEIGVFGGSSIYPTATALKFNGKGIVYAIDPWSHKDCQEGYDATDPNHVWWSSIDLDKIYRDFLTLLANRQLKQYCQPMRMRGDEAVSHFKDESIDLLHIDGNHSEEAALADAILWLPKIKKGGFIWFDDVNWTSTSLAVSYLLEHGQLLDEYSSSLDILIQKD